jgi:hypothetical protein
VAHSANDGTAVFFHHSFRDLMDFDQGQFNFDAKGSENGYRKWREELDAKKKAFESRWGVILNRRVSVTLRYHAKPLTGILEWISDPKKSRPDQPLFRLKGLEFTAAEIDRIVQVDA